jgi:2-polyprenyl-3-methyl-5-hydroxy-6-metoxy-1,4-benzoquinol methylase
MEWFQLNSDKFYKSAKKTRNVYTIVKCASCGLVFVKEPVSAAELREIYSEGYYEGRDKTGYASYSEKLRKPNRLKNMSLRISNLLNDSRKIAKLQYFLYRQTFRNKNKPKDVDMINRAVGKRGTLLDVGCAMGGFLNAARNSGWDVTGVELSEFGSAYARNNLKLNVHTGSLEDVIDKGQIQGNSFDVVTLWDTLEHLTDPAALLKKVNHVLKDGGWFFCSTVNIDSFLSRKQGEHWHFFRPPKHLFYYSEQTLKRYLNNAGLVVSLDDDFRKDLVVLGARKERAGKSG